MQTSKKSFEEVCVNVGVGFVSSFLIWLYVVPPLTGVRTEPKSGFEVTVIFTVWAIMRGFLVRRFYNWRERRDDALHNKQNAGT